MRTKPATIVSHQKRPLTPAEIARLRDVAALPEEAIDTSELPEAGPDQWQNAQVGQFYRPLKRQVTLRVDVPVLDWFKQHATDGKGYQTDINRALREYIAAREKAG